METYRTVTEAINALRAQGYTEDLNLAEECLHCHKTGFRLFHDEFKIDKFFRFQDNNDPSDESILYAISSDKYNVKGILLNAYGVYSDTVTDDMLKALKVE